MLASEDLCPQGNNKEDGLSGHLESHCRVADLHKILLVSQLQPEAVTRHPRCKRMELGPN